VLDFFLYVTTACGITAWVWRCLLFYVFLLQGRCLVFVSWVTDGPTAPLQPLYPPLIFLSYRQSCMQLDSAKWKSYCGRWLCFWLPSDWKSGWASGPVQTFRRNGKSLAPAPDRPTCSIISISTTMSRFRTAIGYVTENNCRRSKYMYVRIWRWDGRYFTCTTLWHFEHREFYTEEENSIRVWQTLVVEAHLLIRAINGIQYILFHVNTLYTHFPHHD